MNSAKSRTKHRQWSAVRQDGFPSPFPGSKSSISSSESSGRTLWRSRRTICPQRTSAQSIILRTSVCQNASLFIPAQPRLSVPHQLCTKDRETFPRKLRHRWWRPGKVFWGSEATIYDPPSAEFRVWARRALILRPDVLRQNQTFSFGVVDCLDGWIDPGLSLQG